MTSNKFKLIYLGNERIKHLTLLRRHDITEDNIKELIKIGERDFMPISLSRCKLRGMRFIDIKIANAHFDNCDLSNTKIENSEFDNCDMSKSYFYNSYLKNTTFFRTNCSSSNFDCSIFQNVIFRRVDCSFARFKKTRIVDAKFIHASLYKSGILKSEGIENVFMDDIFTDKRTMLKLLKILLAR